MIIKNVKINNFGKLENKDIEFQENINLIYGNNESGKSTLLKFISGMFYGASKNKNGKNITDYDKYKPWNNGEFSGKLKYTLDNGETYEIFREFNKKNPKIYNEKLEDISKNFTIDKTKGNQFFYDQTKVDEELFLSTIVSEQKEVELDEKRQSILLQKITNLVGTGEDSTSFNKVINKLNKKLLEEVGTERSLDRPINTTEDRIKEIEKEKNEISVYSDEKYNIEEKNKNILNEITKSEKKVELIKNIKQIKENEKVEKEKIKINNNIIEENNKEIKELQENLIKIDSQKKKQNIENKLKGKNKKAKRYILLVIIMLILVAIQILIYKFLNNIVISVTTGCIFVGLYIALIININKKKNKIIKQNDEQEEKINQEKLKLTNEIKLIEKNNEEYNRNSKEIEEKINNEFNLNIERLQKDNSLIEINNILEKENINIEFEKEQDKLNNLKLNLHKLELEKQNITPKLNNLSSLEEELENLKEKYEELKDNSKCINIAKEYLQLAYEKMKENLTPKFTKNLSDNINIISNGKYKNVKFNDEKGLIVEVENGNYIMAENLSVGTIEQLYLSLRLAMIDEISDEKLPIILDESFAYFDKERLKNVLNFLNEQFKNRQILIFTCTQREKEALDELKLEYNYIEM